MTRSKRRSICSRDGRLQARSAISIWGWAAFMNLSCQASCCSKHLLCIAAKASVPITLASTCASASSCSDQCFWAVWNRSGGGTGAHVLLQESTHRVSHCRHCWAASAGWGAVAVCHQKVLLCCITSCHISKNVAGAVAFGICMLLYGCTDYQRYTGVDRALCRPDILTRRSAHAYAARGPVVRSVTHVCSLGHRTLCAWRPEKTEMWPPRTSTYSLSWLATADMRACAARGGTMLSWDAATASTGWWILRRSTR